MNDPLRPLARRLLKSVLRCTIYEERSKTDPRFEYLLDIERGIYTDAEKQWRRGTSQVSSEKALEALKSEFATARQSVETMLDELEIRDIPELQRCMSRVEIATLVSTGP